MVYMKCKKLLFFFFLISMVSVPLSAEPIRIMMLGDSITAGESLLPEQVDVTNTNYLNRLVNNENRLSYRCELYKLLVDEGYSFGSEDDELDFVGRNGQNMGLSCPHSGFDRDHEGYGGYSTGRLISIINDAPSSDIVLLHIGTNDFGRYTIIESINNIREILDDIFNKNANTKVFIARIIKQTRAGEDWTLNLNASIANMVRDYDESENIRIVNMYADANFTYVAGDDMNPNHSEDNDRPDVHPDRDGYSKMAIKWFTEL